MFTKLWELNKRFLLITGSGLAVFLILNGFVGGCLDSVEGPKGLRTRSGELEKQVRALHKDLYRYHEEKARLADYERHEAALRAELELPAEPELARFDEGSALNQFNQAIDKTWGEAQDKANRANVPLPEKLGPQDFLIERKDGKKEYEEHYAYLGVVRRALSALIDAGMVEISRPDLIEEEMLPVLANDDSVHCLFRGVRFRVTGPYESFLRVLKALQAPQAFLQVNVRSLAAKSPGEERLLKGELEFAALRLVESSGVEAEPGQKLPGKAPTSKGRGRR